MTAPIDTKQLPREEICPSYCEGHDEQWQCWEEKREGTPVRDHTRSIPLTSSGQSVGRVVVSREAAPVSNETPETPQITVTDLPDPWDTEEAWTLAGALVEAVKLLWGGRGMTVIAVAQEPPIVCPPWCIRTKAEHLAELPDQKGFVIHGLANLPSVSGQTFYINCSAYIDGTHDPQDPEPRIYAETPSDGMTLTQAEIFVARLTAIIATVKE